MRKIKETLRLVHSCGLSQRDAARAVNVAPSTVQDYVSRAREAGLTWPLPEGLDDDALEALLFRRPDRGGERVGPVPQWPTVHVERRRKGVTLELLWQEYRAVHPTGYSYSRYCELYRAWAKHLHATMRLDHKAGERGYFDYAGLTLPYVELETGVLSEASVFVAVLGASSYTYAEGQAAQDLANWLAGHVHAFEFWGGVPEIGVIDNVRTGVTSPCRYEPELNVAYHELAVHYGMAVLPARVRRPRDKAKVESAVQVVERWVLAPLRNEPFAGLGELNTALWARLEWLNDREMKHLGKSRRELFEELDGPALRALPASRFEPAVHKAAKVNIDYHVEFDRHYYSVPCQLIHQTVELRATALVVEISHHGTRIASHPRSRVRGGHTTLAQHMPSHHRQYAEWTPERISRWAADVGPHMTRLAVEVMAHRDHPEQGYRSCLGILRLGHHYSDERLEMAAQRALDHGILSYRGVKRILDHGLDRLPPESEATLPAAPPHENLRGSAYYARGDHEC